MNTSTLTTKLNIPIPIGTTRTTSTHTISNGMASSRIPTRTDTKQSSIGMFTFPTSIIGTGTDDAKPSSLRRSGPDDGSQAVEKNGRNQPCAYSTPTMNCFTFTTHDRRIGALTGREHQRQNKRSC